MSTGGSMVVGVSPNNLQVREHHTLAKTGVVLQLLHLALNLHLAARGEAFLATGVEGTEGISIIAHHFDEHAGAEGAKHFLHHVDAYFHHNLVSLTARVELVLDGTLVAFLRNLATLVVDSRSRKLGILHTNIALAREIPTLKLKLSKAAGFAL